MRNKKHECACCQFNKCLSKNCSYKLKLDFRVVSKLFREASHQHRRRPHLENSIDDTPSVYFSLSAIISTVITVEAVEQFFSLWTNLLVFFYKK
jgi:hypothetical protein